LKRAAPFPALCFIALVLAFAPGLRASTDVSYWVWNRSSPLSADELAALKAQGVTELYWHVGELDDRAGEWRWRKALITLPPSELRIVPVIRIDPLSREPFSPAATEALVAKLREAVNARGWSELQIDCDTPDRLLASYARVLADIHKLVPRLTVTALAGWSRTPHWQALQDSVDEIFPMFYDLEADPPGVGHGAAPRPFIERDVIAAQLRDWSKCRIPWRAGLPNFARLTVYNAAGKSRGHIRQWRWNDVCFNTALLSSNTTGGPETVLLRASWKTQIAGTTLEQNESLAARWPNRAALAEATIASKAANARGIVFFRLPDKSPAGGWSLPQLAQLGSTEAPRLVLRRAGESTLVLINESAIDVEPRLVGEGERDRGYALEIDAPAPIWREAMEGDFWRVTAHANPDEKPQPVPVPLATRLTFWFSELHAGGQLKTGLIQTAPGAPANVMRYRILNLPGGESWRPIE
jgi:hypothetical protein